MLICRQMLQCFWVKLKSVSAAVIFAGVQVSSCSEWKENSSCVGLSRLSRKSWYWSRFEVDVCRQCVSIGMCWSADRSDSSLESTCIALRIWFEFWMQSCSVVLASCAGAGKPHPWHTHSKNFIHFDVKRTCCLPQLVKVWQSRLTSNTLSRHR